MTNTPDTTIATTEHLIQVPIFRSITHGTIANLHLASAPEPRFDLVSLGILLGTRNRACKLRRDLFDHGL